MIFFRPIHFIVCIVGTACLVHGLSISPSSAKLGVFPSWERRSVTFIVKNHSKKPVSLLRVRSSCSCAITNFVPCTLDPGGDTSVDVVIPANNVFGAFTKVVYLETDSPDNQFLKLTISGTAVPPVEVQPKREVYLGRLDVGRTQTFTFRIIPVSASMLLKLLPVDSRDGQAETILSRNDEDGSFVFEVRFTPGASSRYMAIRRRIGIEWKHDIPSLTLVVMFSTEQPTQ